MLNLNARVHWGILFGFQVILFYLKIFQNFIFSTNHIGKAFLICKGSDNQCIILDFWKHLGLNMHKHLIKWLYGKCKNCSLSLVWSRED